MGTESSASLSASRHLDQIAVEPREINRHLRRRRLAEDRVGENDDIVGVPPMCSACCRPAPCAPSPSTPRSHQREGIRVCPLAASSPLSTTIRTGIEAAWRVALSTATCKACMSHSLSSITLSDAQEIRDSVSAIDVTLAIRPAEHFQCAIEQASERGPTLSSANIGDAPCASCVRIWGPAPDAKDQRRCPQLRAESSSSRLICRGEEPARDAAMIVRPAALQSSEACSPRSPKL